MKLKDILNEIEISRGIKVEVVEDQIIVNGDKLERVDLTYSEGTGDFYRGYLFAGGKQINLSSGSSGLKEFMEAINYSYKELGISLNEFLKDYGVEVSSSDFDVS